VQDYTAFTNQSYSTCKVRFTQFHPHHSEVMMACGIKANSEMNENYLEPGIAIRTGTEMAQNPGDDTGLREHRIDFVGSALVVKEKYRPLYHYVKGFGSNHTFKIHAPENHPYEYLIAGGWSEGVVYNTRESFLDYVKRTSKEYNNPVTIQYGALEKK
jgi:hypothetical protein